MDAHRVDLPALRSVAPESGNRKIGGYLRRPIWYGHWTIQPEHTAEHMTVRFRRLKAALTWTAFILGSMILVGSIVNSLYPDDWRPTEATVINATVTVAGGRHPSSAVRVRARYDVSGHPHETGFNVFNNYNQSAAEAELRNWPAGRTFTIYFNQNNPASASLTADGGRQATTALAVLATPLIAVFVGLTVIVMRRRRQRST